MLVLLLSLAVLLPAAIYVAGKRAAVASQARAQMRVVIVVKDQELWVEGFFRKLFYLAGQWPAFEVQVADGSSRDQTPEMLLRLQRLYHFDLLLLHNPDDMPAGAGQVNIRVVDVSGLTGHDLLNAPVFSQLKAWRAGKSLNLSK